MKNIKDYIFYIGWILLFLQIIVIVDKNSHSVSDTLLGIMIPFYLMIILLLIWIIRGNEYLDDIQLIKHDDKSNTNTQIPVQAIKPEENQNPKISNTFVNTEYNSAIPKNGAELPLQTQTKI